MSVVKRDAAAVSFLTPADGRFFFFLLYPSRRIQDASVSEPEARAGKKHTRTEETSVLAARAGGPREYTHTHTRTQFTL